MKRFIATNALLLVSTVAMAMAPSEPLMTCHPTKRSLVPTLVTVLGVKRSADPIFDDEIITYIEVKRGLNRTLYHTSHDSNGPSEVGFSIRGQKWYKTDVTAEMQNLRAESRDRWLLTIRKLGRHGQSQILRQEWMRCGFHY